MDRNFDKKLVLEDGSEYLGYGFGANCDAVFEIVFNTSMAGYQDIVTDPSYTDQIVCLTYPLIGNFGMASDNYETKVPTIGGIVVGEYNDHPSNFRSTTTLNEVLEDYGIPGIEGVDTRKITRAIRDNGTQKAMITSSDTSLEDALNIIKTTSLPKDAVDKVSCKRMWKSVIESSNFHVVAIDCGIKFNIVSDLNKKGFNLTVVPHTATAEEILRLKPDGIFISNGPGNPEEVPTVVELIKNLKGKLPIFGIDLGHQAIALAYGAKSYKMKVGHRGANHPVKRLSDGKIQIASQNHSFVVDADSVKATDLEITYTNIIDGTVEGLECAKDKVFSVQFLPTRSTCPQDGADLFDKFIDYMKEDKENA